MQVIPKLFRNSGLVIWVAIFGSAGALAGDDHQTSADDAKHLARTASKSLGQRLGSKLKTAITEGGLVAAVDVCHIEAQDLTQETSTELELEIRRTALKVRNPINTPDAWERTQLMAFESALADGVPVVELEALESVTDADGTQYWRYMKPISTQGLCLACHGDQLAPDVAARIEARYPKDQATGFTLGQLRGAFSVAIHPADGDGHR